MAPSPARCRRSTAGTAANLFAPSSSQKKVRRHFPVLIQHRRRHFRVWIGNEKTRGNAACFLGEKLKFVYGFFGVVAGFLFSAVITSVVKSMLSFECMIRFTPFMLCPDLSKTMS